MSLLLFLTGCNIIPGNEVKTDSLDYKIDSADTKANNDPIIMNVDLPVKKLVITSGNNNHQLEVEVAATDAQRKVGLMNRKSLDENKGMLFIFEKQGYLNFWMKNTLIALDMIFIDESGYIKHVAKKALPCVDQSDQACLLYGSEMPARYVLEVNAGLTDKLGIKTGDKVSWL